MSESAARQRVLGRFIDEPEYEARLRRDPDRVAVEEGVSAEFTRRLASLSAARVAAFRASRAHKQRVREGAPAKKLGW
jgi:hypothetical protein